MKELQLSIKEVDVKFAKLNLKEKGKQKDGLEKYEN